MSSVFVATASQLCPLCHGRYSLPSDLKGSVLCPHCRSPLARANSTIRWNRNAATLAVLAEVFLAVAVFLPFMAVTKLGQKETYSLLGGIGELWRHGDALLAIVIGVFSLAFPLMKNALLIAATTSFWDLTPAHRRTLHALTAKTAKYSMLDVFVAAVLVVVVKLGKSTDVEILSGTLLFCLAIALSMAASACVRFEEAA